MVCGAALPPGEELTLFLDTGLIHLMVVSGAHLMFLERGLEWLPSRARWLTLAFYCWLTGFGPPVVKALARRSVSAPLGRRGWSGLQIEAASVAVTLSFIPEWLFSRSFLMSWVCALALALPPLLRRAELDLALKVHLLMYAFCAGAGVGVFWNALFAPLVGAVLFPLSLAALAVPPLTPLTDLVWEAFLWCLRAGPRAAPAMWFWPAARLVWWPLTLQILFLWGEGRWRRARAYSCS